MAETNTKENLISTESIVGRNMKHSRDSSLITINNNGFRSEFEDNTIDPNLEEDLKNLGRTPNDKVSSEEIAKVLDIMNKGPFNRSLLNCLFDQINLDQGQKIELSQFFSYFMTFLRANHKNIEINSQNIVESKKIMEKYKSKVAKNIFFEKNFDNKLTSSTKFTYKITEFSHSNQNEYRLILINEENKVYLEHELKTTLLNQTQKIKDLKSSDMKILIRVEKWNKKTKQHDLVVEDDFNISDFLYEKKEKKYQKFGITLCIELVFVISKADYYQKILSSEESKIVSFNNEIALSQKTLATSSSFLKYVNPQNENKPEEKQPSMFNIKGSEVSEQIEQIILRMFGTTYIYWEKIFFGLNKLMTLLVLLVIINRSDFFTCIICLCIFAIEHKITDKSNYQKLLLGLAASWLNDCIWCTFYLFNFYQGEMNDSKGWFLRGVSVFVSGILILIKLVMIFALWRLIMVRKYSVLPTENDNQALATKTNILTTHGKSSSSKKNNRYNDLEGY